MKIAWIRLTFIKYENPKTIYKKLITIKNELWVQLLVAKIAMIVMILAPLFNQNRKVIADSLSVVSETDASSKEFNSTDWVVETEVLWKVRKT